MLYGICWIISYLVVRIIVGVFGGLRVEGWDNIPRSGGLIVAPNHLSFADPPIIEMVVRRGSWFMATDELFEMKILGPLARIMRGYPVRQDSPDRSALRKTEDLLKRGESVVVFPEGHVSTDGRLQEIQRGTIMVALRTGVPILPVGLINTDKMMPPHSFSLKRSPNPITVRFGQPISAEELAGGLRGRHAIDHGAKLLRKALLELTGQPDNDAGKSPEVRDIPPSSVHAEAPAPLHGSSLAEYSSG